MSTGWKKTKKNKIEYFVGSDNVFADTSHPHPEEALAKARLSTIIADIIKTRRLTQTEAAKLLGIDQPRVSKLMRGRVREFSLERMIEFVRKLDREVTIIVGAKASRRKFPPISVELR